MDQCSQQKKRQMEAIHEVVENANLNVNVGNSPMKGIVKNILKAKQVNFKKIARKVEKNIKNVLKNLNNKAVTKIYKLTVKVLNSTASDIVHRLLTKAAKVMKTFRRNNFALVKKIKNLISSFQNLVSSSKKKKASQKRMKLVKNTHKGILDVIHDAVNRFRAQISELEEMKGKLENSENKEKKGVENVKNALKKIEAVINGIKLLIEESDKGQSLLQKVFESRKK